MRRINYTMDIQANDFDTLLTTAILHDEYTGTDTALSLSSLNSYTFTVNTDAASYASNRFKILMRQAGVVPVTFVNVNAQQFQNKIVVQWNVADEDNMYKI